MCQSEQAHRILLYRDKHWELWMKINGGVKFYI